MGKGVGERSEVTGAEIAASKRFLVRNGQFILSRIDARHGAFGLIPSSLDGAVVTNDFPVFTPNPQRILPQFLDWMSKTESFVELCKAASEGTTNRVRLKEEKFLAMKIPLPPIEEQRSLVARIEELAGKIEKARSLREKALEETEALWESSLTTIFDKAFKTYPKQFFGQVCSVVRGGSPRPAVRPTYYNGSIPFLKVANLRHT